VYTARWTWGTVSRGSVSGSGDLPRIGGGGAPEVNQLTQVTWKKRLLKELEVLSCTCRLILKLLNFSEPTGDKTAIAIENIADAVTHARFVGTDPGSDEVVLMKILHVSWVFLNLLWTLILSCRFYAVKLNVGAWSGSCDHLHFRKKMVISWKEHKIEALITIAD